MGQQLIIIILSPSKMQLDRCVGSSVLIGRAADCVSPAAQHHAMTFVVDDEPNHVDNRLALEQRGRRRLQVADLRPMKTEAIRTSHVEWVTCLREE